MRADLINLIESTSSTFKDYSQQKAVIASRLESLAIEMAEQDKQHVEPLPDLPDGPDVVSYCYFDTIFESLVLKRTNMSTESLQLDVSFQAG